MPAQEFGGTVMMTISLKLVIYQKWFIIERLTTHMKEKKETMAVSIDVLFVVYIITSHLKNTALIFSRIHNHVQNHSYEESY